MTRGLATCVFGAPLDSGNRGVEALGRSIVAGLRSAAPQGRVTVFDNGWGLRPAGRQGDFTVDYCGVRRSRRIHRGESWANVNMALRIPRIRNVAAQRIRSCDLVLDVSGGDSFSDIYGSRRLRTVLLPKRAALRAGRPLALLPQTYGPFTDPRSERRAAEVIRRAAVAWSRDDESLAVLENLLGGAFDPERHRRGVDVAFALDQRRPDDVPEWLLDLLADRRDPVVGVNVSGLLAGPRSPSSAFELTADYGSAMLELVAWLAREAEVVLVSHVTARGGAGESDLPAAVRLRARLEPALADRVHLAPDGWHADEVKWLIAQLDWFCGARMHAAIAALSTATPVCAIAYSRKFRGVFATCAADDLVVDARSLTTPVLTEQAEDSFARREQIHQRLVTTVPPVVAGARQQIPEIVRTALAVTSG